MTLNPNARGDTEATEWRESEIIATEGATVVSAKPHTNGDNVGHHVIVKPYSMRESQPADILVDSRGDTSVPMEGDSVLVGYRRDSRPVILGVEYGEEDTIPSFEPGERRIGHPASDSHVQLNADGSIDVVGDAGNTITLHSDGSITLNGGSTAPLTDASVSTTTDADGHVTSVSLSLTRAKDVTVPSN